MSSERVVQVDADPERGVAAVRWDGATTPPRPAGACADLAEEYLALATGTSVVAAVTEHLRSLGVDPWVHVRVTVRDDGRSVVSLHLDLSVHEVPDDLWGGVLACAQCAPVVRALVHPLSVVIGRHAVPAGAAHV